MSLTVRNGLQQGMGFFAFSSYIYYSYYTVRIYNADREEADPKRHQSQIRSLGELLQNDRHAFKKLTNSVIKAHTQRQFLAMYIQYIENTYAPLQILFHRIAASQLGKNE